MFITRLRNVKSFLERTAGFITKYGPRLTLLKIKSLLRREPKYSYRLLCSTFPGRIAVYPNGYPGGQKLTEAINAAAQPSMAAVLKVLNIAGDPAAILSSLKSSLRETQYCHVLHDLFTLDDLLGQPAREHYPLLQASDLPESSGHLPRRRILFITSQSPSPYHGGGNRIINFIKLLSLSNDVHLATIYYPVEDDPALEQISPYCRSIYKIPYWKFGNNGAEIRRWLGDTPVDIVHYEWPESLKAYEPALGRHHIFTYMEAVSLRLLMDMNNQPHLSGTWLGTLSQVIHALQVELVESSHLTTRIAVTTKDGEFFHRIHPHQEYVVLNHGVNLNEFGLPDVEPERHTLAFVGNFGHYPNVDAVQYFFADVWAGICAEVPDARIYLVGPDPSGVISQLQDGNRIIVTDRVPDVRPFIQKAAVCIAPLITGAGLRGKVIEYAALRRPFVATSIATTDLVYQDGADYLKADTARDFARKVILLLTEDARRRQMADKAYQTTARNYDTERLVNFLYRLYDHLDSGPCRP
jgi:glycosyltransferase involved in cell wall biosynthesis